jgi:hypothetical protein
MTLRNVRIYLQVHKTLQPRKPKQTPSLPWEPETSSSHFTEMITWRLAAVIKLQQDRSRVSCWKAAARYQLHDLRDTQHGNFYLNLSAYFAVSLSCLHKAPLIHNPFQKFAVCVMYPKGGGGTVPADWGSWYSVCVHAHGLNFNK